METNKKNIQNFLNVVISTKPAVGRTFFSFNIAKEIADIAKEKVLLIDFNSDINDISTRLNLPFKYDLNYFIANICKEDILSQIDKYPNSFLYVIGSGFFRTKEIDINSKVIRKFFIELKKHFKYVFIIPPKNNDNLTKDILSLADVLYYLIEPQVGQFVIAEEFLNPFFFNRNVRIICNKYREEDEKNITDFEKRTIFSVYYKIPKEVITVVKSQNKKKSLNETDKNSAISKAYIELAKKIINNGN